MKNHWIGTFNKKHEGYLLELNRYFYNKNKKLFLYNIAAYEELQEALCKEIMAEINKEIDKGGEKI